jgi:hypothetical protein
MPLWISHESECLWGILRFGGYTSHRAVKIEKVQHTHTQRTLTTSSIYNIIRPKR